MKKCCIVFLLILLTGSAIAQLVIQGRVYSKKTNEALPFVNVSVLNSRKGTTADVEGKYKLELTDEADLSFSFIGFETQTIHVSKATTSPLSIFLSERSTQLNEVVVLSGENPAFRIIRQVTRNIPINDPDNLRSWSYHAYNKLFLTMEDAPDTTTTPKTKGFQKFLNNNHLFMSESFTEHKFVRPGLNKETVLGNRMTGVKDPFFVIMATDFQPFSFYKDYIELFGVRYLNPISKGSLDKYDFTLTDTVYHGADSVFLISYEPLPHSTFHGLKGQLYISSDGYALEHVIAATADPKALIELRIQQEYAKADGHWFPLQLNSEIRFMEYSIAKRKPKYIDRSFLSDIHIGEMIPKREFGQLNVAFDAEANRRDEFFWNTHRSDTLDKKEKSTYAYYAKGGRFARKMNANMKFIEAIVVQKFRAGSFDIPFDYLLRFNNYEQVRVGFGLTTNERISRRFMFGGYGAWGFGDKAFKFGGLAQVNFMTPHEGNIRYTYSHDIGEPGKTNFMKLPTGAFSEESLRNWLVFRMDSVRQQKIEFNLRPARYSQVSVFIRQQQRNPTYAYSYITEKDPFGKQTRFIASEIGIQWRFAFREKYTQVGHDKVVTNIAWPVINFAATHGISGVWEGQYNFTKLEARIDEQWTIRNFGTTTIQIEGGKVSGDVPYPFLYNGKGANYNKSFFNSFVIANYFQTMGYYEFTNDQYAYFFLNHNFGRLSSTGAAWFRPELSVVQNMGIGSLSNIAAHQGVAIKTMDKGYYESGVILNNVLRFKYVKLFYFGLGGGAFMRYGPYSLPSQRDNFSFKFQLTASF